MDNKYFYHLKLGIQCCLFDVRVNDIPVFIEKEGKSLFADLPINHLIKEGKNTISFYIKPEKGKDYLTEEFKANFGILKGIINEHPSVNDLLDVNLRNIYPINEIFKNGFIHTHEIEFDHNGYEPPWFQNKEIELNRVQTEKIVSFYNRYQQALSAKNTIAIREFLKDSAKHISQSFYLDVHAKLEKMVTAYADIFNDSDYTLQPLEIKPTDFQLYANKRIVSLLNDDNHSVLYYLNSEQNFMRNISLKLSLNAQNDFYICLS